VRVDRHDAFRSGQPTGRRLLAARELRPQVLPGSSTRTRDRYPLRVRSINPDYEHADALLCLIQQRPAARVLSVDMAVELLEQLVYLSRPGHVDCIRIAAHGSPVGLASAYGCFGRITTLAEPSHSLPSHSNWFTCLLFPLRSSLLQQCLGRFLLAVLLSVHCLAHGSLLDSEAKRRSEFNFAGPEPCLSGTMVKRRWLIGGRFKRCTSR